MAANIDNEYWKLRKTDGRPKRFESPEIFLTESAKYFIWVKENPWIKQDFIRSGQDAGKIIELKVERPYTLEGLCLFLGITFQTFLNYEKDEAYKDYFEAFAYVRKMIENHQFEGGAVGAFNANIIMSKLGLKQQQELSGSIEHSVTQINFIQKSIEDTTYLEVKDMIENL